MKDNFSKQADLYARYRPEYPQELYDYLLDNCVHQSYAWDCATGNGQVAKVLALHFEEVYGTDISEKQLTNAFQAQNIHYSVCEAEKTSFPDHHFDLITVGQALHWFDFELFFAEVKRVLSPKGVLAVWGYSNMLIDPDIDKYNVDFYNNVTGPYWDEERKHIDDRYKRIHFPFEQVISKDFEMVKKWDLETLEGFFNTWSAVQHYIKKRGVNPVSGFIDRLREVWKDGEERTIRFPVFLKIMKSSKVVNA